MGRDKIHRSHISARAVKMRGWRRIPPFLARLVTRKQAKRIARREKENKRR